MPSNKNLIKSIEELGIEGIVTEGLNNESLAALLSDLKAEVAEPVVAPRKGVFIAEGKSLTSKRGILGPGEQIFVEDLAGGAEAIAGFVKSKHLVKVS